jgi:hypothetical protein
MREESKTESWEQSFILLLADYKRRREVINDGGSTCCFINGNRTLSPVTSPSRIFLTIPSWIFILHATNQRATRIACCVTLSEDELLNELANSCLVIGDGNLSSEIKPLNPFYAKILKKSLQIFYTQDNKNPILLSLVLSILNETVHCTRVLKSFLQRVLCLKQYKIVDFGFRISYRSEQRRLTVELVYNHHKVLRTWPGPGAWLMNFQLHTTTGNKDLQYKTAEIFPMSKGQKQPKSSQTKGQKRPVYGWW